MLPLERAFEFSLAGLINENLFYKHKVSVMCLEQILNSFAARFFAPAPPAAVRVAHDGRVPYLLIVTGED